MLVVSGTSVTLDSTAAVGTVAERRAPEMTAGPAGRAGVLADDVEGDHPRGRGEDGKDHTEGQQLLAGGDETGLDKTHKWLLQCAGKVTREGNFHTSHTGSLGFVSNYNRVISSRHADDSLNCQVFAGAAEPKCVDAAPSGD